MVLHETVCGTRNEMPISQIERSIHIPSSTIPGNTQYTDIHTAPYQAGHLDILSVPVHM